MTLTKELPSWKPRSYQTTAVEIGVSQACAGFLLRPGMGKTTIVYAIEAILTAKTRKKKTLVVAPIKPMYNVWPRQCKAWAEFSHLRVKIAHGKDRVQVLKALDYDMLCINYEGLEWLEEHAEFVKFNFDMLVLDESTKVKNTSTQRFKRLKGMVKWFKRRYILTGMFVPNGLLGLFGQIYCLDEGGALGRYITHYKTKYFYPTDYMGYNLAPHPWAPKEIAKKIAPLCLVLEREGNIELPELLPPNDLIIELPPDVRRIYERAEFEMLLLLEEEETLVIANEAVATSKCRQIANGGVYTGLFDGDWRKLHDLKVQAAIDLVDQLSGEPLLLVYEFKFDLEMLRAAFPEALCLTTHNPKKDDEAISAFCTGQYPVGLAQVSSISLGIDGLQQACSNICMYSLTWKLLDYSQTIDRVWRTGSKSKFVSVHRIIAKDTVDERVLSVLSDRNSTQVNFLNLLKEMRDSQKLSGQISN